MKSLAQYGAGGVERPAATSEPSDMRQTTRRLAEENDRAADALVHLAEITRCAAAQKGHDVKMLEVAVGSVNAVRELLESEARRARRLAWAVAGTGFVLAVAAGLLAVLAVRDARDVEKRYQTRLLEETSKRFSAEAEVTLHRTLVEAARQRSLRDRETISGVQAELSEARQRLEAALVRLGRDAGGRDALAGRERSSEQQVETRRYLRVSDIQPALRQVLDRLRGWAAGVMARPVPHSLEGRASNPRRVAVGNPVVVPSVPHEAPTWPAGSGSVACDSETHECYLTRNGRCAGL